MPRILFGIVLFSIGVGLLAALLSASPERITSPGPAPLENAREGSAGAVHAPRFEDFALRAPVVAPASLDLSALENLPEAELLRREIEGARPTFAGSAYVVPLSCGDGCQEVLVIAARGGTTTLAGRLYAEHGVDYRSGSSLLIVNSETLPEGATRYFYVLEGATLTLVATQRGAKGAITTPAACEELPVRARDPRTGAERELPSRCYLPPGWELIS
ncbi:hypothetical protein GVX82_00465 [Patescibacteria group bacterium]|jgi:hypothetical protein|nr:hypothetical protein [Patescibacteria group bacterium]